MRHLFFLILTFILITPQLPSNAQSDSLTARETMRIGRGTIRYVEWHPDGDLILVDTANGAWLYDDNLNDVAHLPDIRLARFSPDGQYISGVNAADELLIYDARTRDLLHAISQHDHHIHESHWQGNRLATYDGYQLVLWEDLEVTAVIDWRFLEMITWNPSGTMLVAKQLHGKLLIVTSEGDWWEFAAPYEDTSSLQWQDDSTILHSYFFDTLHAATLLKAQSGEVIRYVYTGTVGQYSIRNDWLAVGQYNQFFITNLSTDTVLHYAYREGYPALISWSPDGTQAAYSSILFGVPPEPVVHIVNLRGVTLRDFHDNGSYHIIHMVWQPSGQHLLTVDNEQRMHIWDVETGRAQVGIDTHAGTSDYFSLSSTGHLIAIANKVNGFSVWGYGGMLYQKAPHTSPVELVSWQPFGQRLVTSARGEFRSREPVDPRIMIWDGAIGTTIDVLNLEYAPQDIQWRQDGKALGITASPVIGIWNGRLSVFTGDDLGLGLYSLLRGINRTSDSRYVSTIYLRDSSTLEETLLRVGNLQTRLSTVELDHGHNSHRSKTMWNGAEWLKISWPKGHGSLVGGYVQVSPVIQTIYPFATDPIPLALVSEPLELIQYREIVWSPDASIVIAQSENNILRIWGVESGAYLYWTEGYAFAFSPDSQYLAVLTDMHVNILDASTGNILLAIDEARFPQDDYTLQWSDDGTHLAIGGEGVVSVWEVGS